MNIEVNKLTDVKTEIGNLQVIYLEGTNVPDGKYFVAKSLCKALGYSNPTKEIERIPHDYKIKVSDIIKSPLPKGGLCDTPTSFIKTNKSIQKNTALVNQSGYFYLMDKCTLPNAKVYKDLIFNEIMPEIANTGVFSGSDNVNNNQFITIAKNNKISSEAFLNHRVTEISRMKKMPKSILLGRFKEYMLDFEHINLDKIFTRNLIHTCISHDLFENANRALDYLASETAYYNTNNLDENYRAVIEDLAKEVTRLKKLASYQDFEIEKLQNKIPKKHCAFDVLFID